MKRTPARTLSAAIVLSLLAGVSSRTDAQDGGAAPPDGAKQEPAGAKEGEKPAGPASEEPRDAAPTDEEDAAARKILEAAAERQGGKEVVAPDGKLESFRIEFNRVTVYRIQKDATGSYTRKRMDSAGKPGLIVDWRQGLLRTESNFSGEGPVIRGVSRRKSQRDGEMKEWPWIWDTAANAPVGLQNAGMEKDLEEVERDRRIVKMLLQIGVVRGLLADGSKWKVVEDATYEGTALRRTPPADAELPLRITLWIDPKTRDVTAARLSPNEPGESTMLYTLEYNDEFPKVEGATLRFPFKFHVREQRIAEQEPMDLMTAYAGKVAFNTLTDDDFKPGPSKRKSE